jgi:hypothetical protein
MKKKALSDTLLAYYDITADLASHNLDVRLVNGWHLAVLKDQKEQLTDNSCVTEPRFLIS